MPIDLSRPVDIHTQIERLDYGEGVEIKETVERFFTDDPFHYYTADELSARISTAAAPVQIEHVLSQHPGQFDHKMKNGKIYWQLKE